MPRTARFVGYFLGVVTLAFAEATHQSAGLEATFGITVLGAVLALLFGLCAIELAGRLAVSYNISELPPACYKLCHISTYVDYKVDSRLVLERVSSPSALYFCDVDGATVLDLKVGEVYSPGRLQNKPCLIKKEREPGIVNY